MRKSQQNCWFPQGRILIQSSCILTQPGRGAIDKGHRIYCFVVLYIQCLVAVSCSHMIETISIQIFPLDKVLAAVDNVTVYRAVPSTIYFIPFPEYNFPSMCFLVHHPLQLQPVAYSQGDLIRQILLFCRLHEGLPPCWSREHSSPALISIKLEVDIYPNHSRMFLIVTPCFCCVTAIYWLD